MADDMAGEVAETPAGPVESKRMTAAILGILLGGLGVHKFYLGYTTPGIIQIVITVCTFGVGHFVGVIEGVMYLLKTDAEFVQTYQVGKKEWF